MVNMCCFSKPVVSVGSTQIFARFLDATSQCIVYEMRLDAAEDLAMILPIPVARPAAGDAVTFVDLSGYPGFFGDLEKAFPDPPSFGRSSSDPFAESEPRIAVRRVGSFEASFVPSIADFSRLDPRFRLDEKIWNRLPRYEEFGFAVFKLRKGNQQVHPMAFRFQSALPGKLFFPTLHIHDGEVHETEEFDHTLYAQAWTNAVIKGTDWQESPGSAVPFVNLKKARSLVWGGGHLYKRTIIGLSKNEDIIGEARTIG